MKPEAFIYLDAAVSRRNRHRELADMYALAKRMGYLVLDSFITDVRRPNAYPAMLSTARKQKVAAVFIPHRSHVPLTQVRAVCAVITAYPEVTLPKLKPANGQ